MVGSIATNLHEGSRSEYLAQYVFASFGTAVPVPHQEDSGVDLYCTLTEQIGRRAWPRAYFSVQVKSTMDSWKFKDEESIRWLVEHPLPIFLCVVDKSKGRVRLYHTSPRFYIWSLPPLPPRLELIPTVESEGQCTKWEGGTKFSLSAPILDASMEDLLKDDFHREAREVLQFWISVDLANLERINAGIHSFTMPASYRVNSTELLRWAIHGVTKAENIESAIEHLKESLSWISSQLHRRGDISGAARCAMLLRHLYPDDTSGGTHDGGLHRDINRILKKEESYLFVGVRDLNKFIDQELTK